MKNENLHVHKYISIPETSVKNQIPLTVKKKILTYCSRHPIRNHK